jgi:hypothetical protein
MGLVITNHLVHSKELFKQIIQMNYFGRDPGSARCALQVSLGWEPLRGRIDSVSAKAAPGFGD